MKHPLQAACLAFRLSACALAQETISTIFGRVVDSQNAAVAGANIVVTNVGTNAH